MKLKRHVFQIFLALALCFEVLAGEAEEAEFGFYLVSSDDKCKVQIEKNSNYKKKYFAENILDENGVRRKMAVCIDISNAVSGENIMSIESELYVQPEFEKKFRQWLKKELNDNSSENELGKEGVVYFRLNHYGAFQFANLTRLAIDESLVFIVDGKIYVRSRILDQIESGMFMVRLKSFKQALMLEKKVENVLLEYK